MCVACGEIIIIIPLNFSNKNIIALLYMRTNRVTHGNEQSEKKTHNKPYSFYSEIEN